MTHETEQNLANELIKEKRRDRRWRNLRTLAWLLVVIAYAFLIFGPSLDHKPKGPYVSLVRLSGTIMPNSPLSAKKVLPALDKAFKDKSAVGVVLVINSPGGSAVQSLIIHDKIIQLKKLYHKKVTVVGEDALASGAYLIATAADKIFVNPDSLTGSIGVIFSGFGFVDAINKLGITRRVYTAGQNKDRLDPFETPTLEDIEKIKTVLDEVHKGFIQTVIDGRGDRLKGNKDELFSGDFWSGTTAVQLGLVDGTDNLWVVLEKEFHAKKYKDYSPRPSLMHSFFAGVNSMLQFGLTHDSSPIKEQAY